MDGGSGERSFLANDSGGAVLHPDWAVVAGFQPPYDQPSPRRNQQLDGSLRKERGTASGQVLRRRLDAGWPFLADCRFSNATADGITVGNTAVASAALRRGQAAN